MIKQLVNISPEALKIIKQKAGSDYFRIAVKSGDCEGFGYKLSVEKNKNENDIFFEFQDVKVIIDPKSMKFVDGLTLDYISTILEQKFVFINPNAKSECSCGKSFSI